MSVVIGNEVCEPGMRGMVSIVLQGLTFADNERTVSVTCANVRVSLSADCMS